MIYLYDMAYIQPIVNTTIDTNLSYIYMHIYVQKDTQFIQYKIQMNPRSVRGPFI